MKPLYPGREEVLYLVAPKVCELVREDLKTFSGFKKKYTEAFLDELVQATLVAQQMPNAKSRGSKQKLKRSSLGETNVMICSLFQDLMQYVEEGFEEKNQKDIRTLAGADYYAAAANRNWKASKTMQRMAMELVDTYPAELATGYMPDAFAADFGKLSVDFGDELAAMLIGKTTKVAQAGTKIEANNGVYKTLRAMMKDGRKIYKKNPLKRSAYSYSAQAKMVGSAGKTGFRFCLIMAETKMPVQAARVSFLPSGEAFADVSKKGVLPVHLPELKTGDTYKYVLTAPGCEEVAGELVATTGVMHRVDLVLKRAVMSVEVGSLDVKRVG